MSDVTIKYKGQSIATMDASGTKTLGTQGKYCEGNIAVEYTKPAGPSGTKQISITENGTVTEDVTNYASAEITVDVQGGGGVSWTDIATGAQPSGRITIDAPILYDYAIRFLAQQAWSAFVTATKVFNSTARGNSHLTGVVFPNLTVIGTGGYQFSQNTDSFLYADLGPCPNIPLNAFFNDSALQTVILRKVDAIVTLTNVNGLTNGTPFKSGGTGGTIYIPKVLYDHLGDGSALDYKAATNWSTVDGYGTITWAQIEGSIYETQYADGTPIT